MKKKIQTLLTEEKVVGENSMIFYQNSPNNIKIRTMETIVKCPGLQHLTENIFLNLNHGDLEKCRLINGQCEEIVNNPMFWLKKFIRRGMSQKNQIDWTEAIQITKEGSDFEHCNILQYLKKSSKNEKVVDLPCYINRNSLKKHSELFVCRNNLNDTELFDRAKFWRKCNSLIISAAEKGNAELVQILVLLYGYVYLTMFKTADRKLFKTADRNYSPIHIAAERGHLEVVKILVPLASNSNFPDEYGWTPIHYAAGAGHIQVVKILAPLADNANAPNELGKTPIFYAHKNGYQEIVEYLQSIRPKPRYEF